MATRTANNGAAGNFSSGFSPLIVISTLFNHILSVIFGSAKKKMFGVDASPIIANMANKHSLGYFSIKKFPSVSICSYIFTINCKSAITIIVKSVSFPVPTIINSFFIYKGIVSFFSGRKFVKWISMSIPSFPMFRTKTMSFTEFITSFNFASLLNSCMDNIWTAISNKAKIVLVTISKTSTKFITFFNLTHIFHMIDYTKLYHQQQEEKHLWLL